MPVYRKLRERGVECALIANGKATEMLQALKEPFRWYPSPEAVLRDFPSPAVLMTSMCSGESGNNLGRDLISALIGCCPTIGLNDYWGASLDWGIAQRPDYIVVNDEIGAQCVREAWRINPCDEWRIQQLGYPALDAYCGFDKAMHATVGEVLLGVQSRDAAVVAFIGDNQLAGHGLAAAIGALNAVRRCSWGSDRELIFVAREHPRLRDNAAEAAVWDKALGDFLAGRLIAGKSATSVDLNDLLARADLVIGAASTVMITAAVLRVPNITFYDEKIEAYFRAASIGITEPPVVSLGCSAKATSVDELASLIKKNFEGGLGLEEAQKRAFKVDGRNAERVADFVISVMGKNAK